MKKTREISIQATDWCHEHAKGVPVAWEWEDKYAELIIQDVLHTLRELWCEANDAPKKANEDARDVGMRVGTKSGLIKAMNRITERYQNDA